MMFGKEKWKLEALREAKRTCKGTGLQFISVKQTSAPNAVIT